MAFLADDLLEGREAGTRGDALAQLYLRTRFETLGLKPAGDGGSYLQRFSVRGTSLELGSVDFRVIGPTGTAQFENGIDVAIYGDVMEADQRIEAPVVFAGSGIVAPEHGIDDYRGLDVKGKIVAVLGGPPAFLPAAEAAHYGSADQQRIQAAKQGAIGVIHLWTPALEQRFAFERIKSTLGRTDLNWIGADGQPKITAPGVRLRAFARGTAAEALFKGTPHSFSQLIEAAKTSSPRGFDLMTKVSLARRSRHDDKMVTANIAGLIEGSDPQLKHEIVVLTAHYDHIGIGPAVAGDQIYNGALDNAAGTAMLIEVARNIMSDSSRPKRSILFLAVGAEEKGMIGSDYFAQNPTVRGGKIVANINLDGAMPFYDFRDVVAFGAEQSQIGEHLASAAAQLGLTVASDPFPEEGILTRSDQISFIKRGVPAVFLYIGFTAMDGSYVGRKIWDRMTATSVHRPGDDLSQQIDYDVLAKFTDVFRRLTLETANAATHPQWYEDSLFGARFAPNAPKAARPKG